MLTINDGISADTTSNASLHGVSWAAIFAGAFAIAALSLILLVLGTGLGFSVISPWPHSGITASAFGSSTVAWLILSQVVAAAAGGYLAGRLRTKWITVHSDEVYFRDTAQGFVAWAVAALFFAIVVGTVFAKTATVAASTGVAVGGAAMMAADSEISGHSRGNDSGSKTDGMEKYMIDSLFRTGQTAHSADANSDSATRLEITRIFVNSARASTLPQSDQQYVAQVIANRTGMSVSDADKRVSDVFSAMHTNIVNAEQNALEAADAARKTAAHSALWMFVALLCGAFVASLAATVGGRQRDNVIHNHIAV